MRGCLSLLRVLRIRIHIAENIGANAPLIHSISLLPGPRHILGASCCHALLAACEDYDIFVDTFPSQLESMDVQSSLQVPKLDVL